jgi:hypothetical protein
MRYISNKFGVWKYNELYINIRVISIIELQNHDKLKKGDVTARTYEDSK